MDCGVTTFPLPSTVVHKRSPHSTVPPYSELKGSLYRGGLPFLGRALSLIVDPPTLFVQQRCVNLFITFPPILITSNTPKLLDKRGLLIFSDLRKDFETPPYSTQIKLGSQAELRCHPPMGRPRPTVTGWLRNGVPIETGNGDSNFIISSTGHLLILQARCSYNYTNSLIL